MVAIHATNCLSRFRKQACLIPPLNESLGLDIPSRGIIPERSSRSRVRFAAKNAPLTSPGRSETPPLRRNEIFWNVS